jgi:hypothetical protein
MALPGLTGALVRRWYVTLGGLAMTVVLCLAAAASIPVTYRSESAVLLVPPPDKPGANPYLNLAALQGLTTALPQALADEGAQDLLTKAGITGTYSIKPDQTSNAPILLVTGTNSTPSGAQSTTKRVVAFIPKTLLRLQERIAVPQGSMVTSTVLSAASDPAAISRSQTRGIIGAGTLGALLTLLVVAGIEKLRRRPTGDKDTGTTHEPAASAYDVGPQAARKPQADRTVVAATTSGHSATNGNRSNADQPIRPAKPPRAKRSTAGSSR